ncbi:RIB43A-like with coiled-coils protein 2 [Labrus bergylta]|uniref:RIB43A-like with coiled-coils protein 2 n=1 Tax=Labrus bergylta TaxID=56723 RepID=UPI0009B421AE|nr:RIB43A-like with coiled-coils protein 2 [Labrus bergylta]
MLNTEILSDRVAKANLQKRRDDESERRERIFNHKVRTIGVDKEALDLQIKEKKTQEKAEKEQQDAQDADLLHNSKVACLLHNRQMKGRQAVEKDIVSYRRQYQQPQRERENDLNDPDCKDAETGEAQMMLQGLVGEDLDSESRRQRQKEQLRGWLMQQQSERASAQQQRKLEGQRYDQSRVEMDIRALQLHSIDSERRKAAAVATKEFNLAKIEEERRQKADHKEEDDQASTTNHLQGELMCEDAPHTPRIMVLPGLCPSSDRRVPSESQQQVIQFQKYQIEEKKRIDLEERNEEEQHERVRLDSARSALLLERQQARLNKQLRRHLDNTNLRLAETHKQQKPDIEKGCIDDSFFSQFNTCSR